MDGVDQIYWINMNKCVDRKNAMEKILKDPCFKGIQTTRIEAIDGKRENILDYVSIDEKKSIDIQYACLISHFKAMHKFCDIGINGQIALIFEDDMVLDFKPYWKKTIRQISNEAPNDWGIIQLSYISHNIPKNTFEPILYNNNNAIYGIGAYIIKYEAAQTFINMMYDKITKKYIFSKIREPDFVYHISDHYIYSFIRGYSYRYPFFTYLYNQVSTVNTTHMDFHNKSRFQVENFLKNKRDDSLNIENIIWTGTFISIAITSFTLLLLNIRK